jgi:hypothetical protein
MTKQQVIHPMVKFQRHVRSLVDSNILKPSDSLWKIAFLYEEEWTYWRKELESFEFSMRDPVSELLKVDVWEDE